MHTVLLLLPFFCCWSKEIQEKKIFRTNKLNLFLLPLLDGTLKVLTLNQVRDIILILVVLLLASLLLLQALVALGKLAQRGQAVGAELVQDAGDEFSEFLLFAVAVDGEGVGGDGGVDYITLA